MGWVSGQTTLQRRNAAGRREDSDRKPGDVRSEEAAPGRTLRSCRLEFERHRTRRLLETECVAHADGFRVVAGVDEVGRGCLAGPVYAAAAVLAPGFPILGLDDSKVLLREVREELAERILRTAVGVGLGAATPAEIDALGIVEATFMAMRRAIAMLTVSGIVPDLVLFDAVHVPGLMTSQKAFIRGDSRVACIAAASIVAKTERDRQMERIHRQYPHYGFVSHKGYATPEHLSALKRHGPSPVHRLTFERVLPLPCAPASMPLTRTARTGM